MQQQTMSGAQNRKLAQGRPTNTLVGNRCKCRTNAKQSARACDQGEHSAHPTAGNPIARTQAKTHIINKRNHAAKRKPHASHACGVTHRPHLFLCCDPMFLCGENSAQFFVSRTLFVVSRNMGLSILRWEPKFCVMSLFFCVAEPGNLCRGTNNFVSRYLRIYVSNVWGPILCREPVFLCRGKSGPMPGCQEFMQK